MRPRDPRFDETSGSYDVDGFTKAYAFLEEYRTEELEKLKEAKQKLNTKKRRKDPDAARKEEELTKEIKCRIQQDKQRKHLGELRAAELSLKSKEREKVKTTGKVPFFHGRKEARKLIAQSKKEKKGSSTRDKAEERREQKRAAKEKKLLPTRR
ncbi:unnamed protein product [Durusdinium trenchii]|uniref:rRNA biogenesis protein RRP36 n=2 Tax=Durusdinium trenchii TaxID=1381693 RepID=A0ABP0SWH5_9DINO